MNRLLPFALFALGATAACQTTPPNPMTFNFNRPTGAAQVCVRVETHADGTFLTDSTGQIISTPEPRPLADCRTQDPSVVGSAMSTVPTQMNGRFYALRMFALVSQSDRGELAVVNTHPTIGPSLIDNDPMIPGFTFIPVGAFPGAVAVHPEVGAAIYVANTGENTISVVETASILRTQTAGSGSIAGVIRLGGRPSDLAIGRVSGHYILFVTVPDLGDVVTIDVTDPRNAGVPQTIHLGARISGGLDGGTGGDGGTGDAGTTGTYRPERIAIATIDRTADGTVGDISRVYVTDSRSTYVHVLDAMSDGTVVEATTVIDAHATTRPITVTPTVFSVDPPRRFIYVGGADDGALWVIDESTGERVPVNASQAVPACRQGTSTYDPTMCPRIDAKISLYQMPIKSAVISLAAVTRDAMDPTTCTTRVEPPAGSLSPSGSNPPTCVANTAYSATEGAASVNTIEGVAVIAGLRDSTLRIIDVEDWQAYCAPDRRAQSGQTVPLAQPHLPRNSVAYPDPGAPNPYGLSTPAYSVNGAATAPSTDDPQLAQLDGTACAENQICIALPPPPTLHDDTWTMVFEGPIPELTLRVGALQAVAGSATDLHAEAPAAQFCTRGAVGPDGDQLGDIASLADPSPCVQDPVDNDAGPRVLPDPALCDGDGGADAGMTICSQVFGTATAPCNRDLQITHLTQDSITVTPIRDPSSCSAVQITDAAQLRGYIQQCYPQAVLLAIRPRQAWTVASIGTNYVHSVTVDSSGQCVQTLPNPGRIVENQRFDGVGFSTFIRSGMRPTQRNAAYSFTVSSGMTQLLISGGLVPSTMFYSCPSRRLYFVDQSRASLVEYPLAPMSTPRTFN